MPLLCLPRNGSNLPAAVCFPPRPCPALKQSVAGRGDRGEAGSCTQTQADTAERVLVLWCYREGGREPCPPGHTLGGTVQLRLLKDSRQQGSSWAQRLFGVMVSFPPHESRHHLSQALCWRGKSLEQSAAPRGTTLGLFICRESQPASSWGDGTARAEPQPTPMAVAPHRPWHPDVGLVHPTTPPISEVALQPPKGDGNLPRSRPWHPVHHSQGNGGIGLAPL